MKSTIYIDHFYTKIGNIKMTTLSKQILLCLLTFSLSFASSYELDNAHSNIEFSVTHMLISTVTGNFNDFNVEFKFDENDLDNSSVRATIMTTSVNTGNERRDDHLRQDDFFNSNKYPAIVFKSTKIEKANEGFIAQGELTIRDVTKSIALPFKVSGPIKDARGNTRIGVKAQTIINRQEYNITWNKTLDNGGLVVSDEVEVIINVEFIKQ